MAHEAEAKEQGMAGQERQPVNVVCAERPALSGNLLAPLIALIL